MVRRIGAAVAFSCQSKCSEARRLGRLCMPCDSSSEELSCTFDRSASSLACCSLRISAKTLLLRNSPTEKGEGGLSREASRSCRCAGFGVGFVGDGVGLCACDSGGFSGGLFGALGLLDFRFDCSVFGGVEVGVGRVSAARAARSAKVVHAGCLHAPKSFLPGVLELFSGLPGAVLGPSLDRVVVGASLTPCSAGLGVVQCLAACTRRHTTS
mmetsp:Transcript_59860/g.110851  ORF Transcript_59860/g.110851 Transcript_59860/m.110851 type:complete len:212 (-) Transcript_59860:322-957(-)